MDPLLPFSEAMAFCKAVLLEVTPSPTPPLSVSTTLGSVSLVSTKPSPSVSSTPSSNRSPSVSASSGSVFPSLRYAGHLAGRIDLDLALLKQTELGFGLAFTDTIRTVHELLAFDDRAVMRITTESTHSGEFRGIPPTGRKRTR